MMASIANPLKDLRASMAVMSDPIRDLRASLMRISNPFAEIRNTVANSASLKSMREIEFEVQSNIEIDSKGTVTLDDKRITATALQELSNKIFYDSSIAKTNSLEESINNLVNEIRKQKDPLSQRILICFIYPLIIIVIASFLNPIVDHNVKSYLNSDKRALEKELKANANSVIDDRQLLLSLRYVSVDILNVRTSASTKSKPIGCLYFSSTVLIIEKRKNWTLIEWHDPETGAEITGWVFSRYLAKFR
ncbi:MAG: SH3 domain-containing protein [Psychrobacter sp.]|uniref:SH3 domain-containing protein n=1 Tax=Psychrobacter sp. AOP31-E1-50 TaxID=3457692 RepID=UPI003FDB63A0